MTTSLRYKTIAYILVLIFSFTLIACAHNSAKSASSKKESNKRQLKKKMANAILLTSGDVLDLRVWENSDLDGVYTINRVGKIFIPLVGSMKASGLNVMKLRANIIKALTKYIVNPQVNLTVISHKGRKVSLLGEVNRPGVCRVNGKADNNQILVIS